MNKLKSFNPFVFFWALLTVVVFLGLFLKPIATLADVEGPYLCSENKTSKLGLNNSWTSFLNQGSGFYVCFTSPQKMEAKIFELNLIKSDGSKVSLLNSQYTPIYQDLVSGNIKLVDNLSLASGSYDGTYTGIQLIIDNEIKISANASYQGTELAAGVTKYCYTREVGLNSFQGTANGIPFKFGSSNTATTSDNANPGSYEIPASAGGSSSYSAPGATVFRFDGSPGVLSGMEGVDRVFIGSLTTEGAYWSKVRYVLSGDASSGVMETLDNTKTYTRNPTLYDTNTNVGTRNSKYISWTVNFAKDLVINSTVNSTINLNFDFAKAVGFAFGYDDGVASWNSTDCHRMILGPLGVSLSIL